MKRYIVVLLVLVGVVFGAKMPTKDIKGSKDSFLGRYKGSIIIAYNYKRFDKFKFAASKLEFVKGKTDDRYNKYYEPKKTKSVTGEVTIITYAMPKGVSSFEVFQNYKDAIAKNEGEILFECEGGCGGNPKLASSYGSGAVKTSLQMYLQPMSKVRNYIEFGKPGDCAYNVDISEQYYVFAKVKDSYVGVVTYTVANDAYCGDFKNRAIAVLYIATPKKKDNKMVVVKADKMKEKIEKEGKVALYGIYFDTDKTEVKPSSMPTIKQIAKLLKDNPKLKLLIVGHTDNEGTFIYNKKLSEGRAKSVVRLLVTKYGINADRLHPVGVSYAAPVASNATNEGRAKNRRVELVELVK
jgi:outer membrane protein OmpA-like peptidoglycan-associated protein